MILDKTKGVRRHEPETEGTKGALSPQGKIHELHPINGPID